MKTRIMTGIAAFGCVAFVLSAVLFSTADADVKAADDGKKAKQGKVKGPGAKLHGFRFEFPCKEKMPENPRKGAESTAARTLESSEASLSDPLTQSGAVAVFT